MMSFINSRIVEISKPLKAAYFPFSRAQDLSRALSVERRAIRTLFPG